MYNFTFQWNISSPLTVKYDLSLNVSRGMGKHWITSPNEPWLGKFEKHYNIYIMTYSQSYFIP